jgi:hypothetical protein
MAITKVINDLIDLNATDATKSLKMPTGAAYSGTTEDGMVRNDTDGDSQGSASTMQHFNGTDWKNYENLPNGITANFLVVAGGGGGASYYYGGAGGAGGLRTSHPGGSGGSQSSENSLLLSLSTPYTVTVGVGGASKTTRDQTGQNGFNSSITDGASISIESIGGGGGSMETTDPTPAGGSGGGATGSGSAPAVGGLAVTSPTIQGFDGGDSGVGNGAAGGGGAGTLGGDSASNGVAGNGGSGLEVNIIGGTGNFYAGGGGGAGGNPSNINVGLGGSGIGGDGGTYIVSGTNRTAQGGVISTGSGGGGGSHNGTNTGDSGGGGSGIVILRYPTASVASYQLDTSSDLDTTLKINYPTTNIGYYKFNDNLNDSSGSGPTASYTNAAYTTGRFGKAADLNGTNSVLTIPQSVFTAVNLFSLSFWVKTTETGTGLKGLANTGATASSGKYGWTMYFNLATGYINYYTSNNSVSGGTLIQTQGNKLNDGYWHNVGISYNNNGDAVIYVDGRNVVSGPNTSLFTQLSDDLGFGFYGSSGSEAGFLNSQIDQVRVFSTVLSDANFLSLYNESTVIPSTDGTDSILQFIGGTGTVTFS